MQDLTNAFLGQVAKSKSGDHGCNGMVTAYDDSTYMCKVLLLPEEKETGWLPIPSIWTGAEWGLFCPPTVGDLVEVEFINGDFESGYSIKRFFTDEEPPISGIPSGEFWLVHATGTFFKFLNDGTIDIFAFADFILNVGGNVTVNVAGSANVHVSGNVTASVGGDVGLTVSGNINSSAPQWNHTGNIQHTGSYAQIGGTSTHDGVNVGKTHKHSGVSTGGSQTGNPV